jgi:hypothetical protein
MGANETKSKDNKCKLDIFHLLLPFFGDGGMLHETKYNSQNGGLLFLMTLRKRVKRLFHPLALINHGECSKKEALSTFQTKQ